jgi:hypothetical protein
MQNFRTPPYYVEILGVQEQPINDPIMGNNLTDAVGLAAKNLHIAAHYNQKFHKAFVYKNTVGFGWCTDYDFEFHSGEIMATLTVLNDHRVRVTYHNGKEPEILYL